MFITGKLDIGYGVLRLFPEQKWEPRFLANPVAAAILAVTFTWENANEQAKVLYELGGRPRVVKKWWGWVVDGEYK